MLCHRPHDAGALATHVLTAVSVAVVVVATLALEITAAVTVAGAAAATAAEEVQTHARDAHLCLHPRNRD